MQSQNGWPVIDSVEGTRLWVIPGTGRSIRLHAGHAGLVLAHLALWFSEVIEPIGRGVFDDWGWAVRNVRGSDTAISNHSSGTAMDLNATHHPLGIPGTYLNWQYVKIRAHLAFYGGVIRAGLAYHGRVDEMHYEINKGHTAVYRVARRLAKTGRGQRIVAANPGYHPPIDHKPGTRDLKVGSTGADVRFVQSRLGAKVDGAYGPKTAHLVKGFEARVKHNFPGLRVDGTVGKTTWRALGVKVKY